VHGEADVYAFGVFLLELITGKDFAGIMETWPDEDNTLLADRVSEGLGPQRELGRTPMRVLLPGYLPVLAAAALSCGLSAPHSPHLPGSHSLFLAQPCGNALETALPFVLILLELPLLAPVGRRVQIAAPLEGQSLGHLLDTELQGTEGLDLGEVESLVRLALLCLTPDPKERPSMSSVAKLLGNKGLAGRWAQWQEEAVNMKDVINLVRNPDLWNDMTTGVTLTGSDPRAR